jgi:hypothetical protein
MSTPSDYFTADSTVEHAAEHAAKSVSAAHRRTIRKNRTSPSNTTEEEEHTEPTGLNGCIARIQRHPFGSLFASFGLGLALGCLLGDSLAYMHRPPPSAWKRAFQRR